MSKTLSLSALGLLAAGLLLATPEQSHAQGYGISVNFGRGGLSYYNDAGCDYGAYRYGAYSYPYSGPAFNLHYDSGYGYRNSGYGYGNSGYGYGGYPYSGGYRDPYSYGHRSGIVHPETHHWTPGSGWHSHGHIHVPSRHGHRTIPY